MMRKIAFVVAALSALPAPAIETPASITNVRIEVGSKMSPADALKEVGRGSGPEWVGWSVPAVAAARDVCCFRNNFKQRGCSLSDRKDNGWGTSDDPRSGEPTEMYVLVEARNGRASRVRVVSPACPVDGAHRRLLWLGPVDPGASLAALGKIVEGPASDDDVVEPALAAVAYHSDSRADALIEKRALDRSLDEDSRQQALFWAGNARGETGYRLLDRVLDSEPDGEVRQHAVFALSQSSVPQAVDRIKRVGLEDRDGEVRGQALFWLAQTNAPGAGEWILGRLDAERDEDVREQAVFALSELDDGTDWLLRLMRSKRDPEIIRRALFWLGQSDDPRALEEIGKILDR
jgi:hypothetical protein